MIPIVKKTGFFTSFDGTSIYYELRGQGEPLIFSYGIGCLINHWHFQIEELSKNYQTIVYDYRGHNKSALPEDINSMTTESLAKDLLCLMKHLKIEKATFLGHSYGGQVLTKTYQLEPEKFKALVMVNGYASNPLDDIFAYGLATKIFQYVKKGQSLIPETSAYLWKKVIDNPVAGIFAALSGGFNIELTQFKDIEIYLKGVSSVNLEYFVHLFQDMVDFDGRSILPTILVPTLLISGEKDGITPVKYQIEMQKKIKESEFLKIPYGSHCSQLDFPDFVNLRIAKFLKEKLS